MGVKKVGRPVTVAGVETIGVRVGEAMAHDLNFLSTHWNCSVSDVVRRLVSHEFDILGMMTTELQSTRRRRAGDMGKRT